MRPGPLALTGASVLAALTAFGVTRLLRELDAVEVDGRSMTPTLEPGDRLLVEAWTYRRRAPRPGEIVLAADPRASRRELVKRVGALDETGVTVHGDGAASTDSRTFGPVPLATVQWRAIVRYWPPGRIGRLSG